MEKYYKNADGKPYGATTQEIIKRDNLTEITKAEFNALALAINTKTEAEILAEKVNEKKAYLNSTMWINDKYNDVVLVNKKMTHDEYVLKYKDVYTSREEARAFINDNEVL